jgi:hypothetical protein
MKSVFRHALKEWEKLPADQRQPGKVQVPERAKIDAAYHREAPKGTHILQVYTRILQKNEQGDFEPGECSFKGGDRAAHDRLWIMDEEWRTLLGGDVKVGQKIALPDRLMRRLARFHLVDSTRGEPPAWKNSEVRRCQATLVVDRIKDGLVEGSIMGDFLLSTHPDAAKAERGFEGTLQGSFALNPKNSQAERFELVALGEHWGAGPFTHGARPGRQPLGIYITYSPQAQPSDRVPPQGARWLQGYVQAEKN